MSEDKWQWLAEVRVAAEGEKFHLSTGVPLSSRYVLTAGHGVCGAEEAEVRFIHDFRQDPKKWRKAKIVWKGGTQKLDAALLELDPIDDLVSFIYSDDLPNFSKDWEGYGFPAANKISEGELEGHRDSKGFYGKFMRWGNMKTGELDLTVEPKPEFPGQWAGISGAPVLIDDKVVGIIKSYQEDFGGRNLAAVAIRQLFKDDSFAKHFVLPDWEDFVGSICLKLENLLKGSEKLSNVLGNLLSISNAVHRLDEIVKTLVNLRVDEFEWKMADTISGIENPQESDWKTLEMFLNLLLPIIYDITAIHSVHDNLGKGSLLRVPVATRTVAELLMAAVQRRAAAFRKPISGDEWPVGETLLEKNPESGFSNPEKSFIELFDQMMNEKFVSVEDLGKPPQVLRILVNQELAYRARRKGGDELTYKHYYICSPKEAETVGEQFNQLKEFYPQVIFVVLADDPMLIPEERKIGRPIREILAARNSEGAR